MLTRNCSVLALAFSLLIGSQSIAQDQTVPGAGNDAAVKIALRSQLVKSAFDFLFDQAQSLSDGKLRFQTLDAIANPFTCIRHRANVTDAVKNKLLQTLIDQDWWTPLKPEAFKVA